MRAPRFALSILAGAMLSVGAAQAQQMEPVTYRQPRPGSSALAAAGNIIFMPVRVVVTAIGAELGGLTGWLTAGNRDAAQDIWGLFDGQQYLQPDMMYGDEPLELGHYEFTMHVTQP
jgi:hypothetical protein